MRTYPIPFNEEARVRAVSAVKGLSRDNDVLFDSLCDAARKLFDCPIAHISVIEDATQWYKSVVGIELGEMPKNNSFCTHTIMSGEAMVIPDLSKDAKFAEHPMVAAGGPQARFYAGVPLVLSSGFRFGSLCVLDVKPHEPPSETQMAVLHDLGKAVVAALEREPAAPAAPADSAAKSTFMTLVGHELRTPLTVIKGGLQLLELRTRDEANTKMARGALRSAEHLMRLVEAVLSFSNTTTGELQLNDAPVSLKELLGELQDIHASAATESSKTLRCDTDLPEVPVTLDESHMKTCLSALLLNSLLHGGTEIKLGAQISEGGYLELSVTDNGHLHDHVELAQLYEPFVVGGNMDHRGTGGGLGLGLPLTRKLVDLHGGEFEVHTSEDSTTALIRLPKWRSQPVEDVA
ncbi:GAF domain-containing sensor histidine kinase [Cognatishimia sp. SS12]|uniref:GAF domain-containing sensor histidine kinase n=1 Tax=Cognatishimia sp. SS12 TaxID=2979465 RepID=UPI00232D2CC4|nr:GAF domain-containing sensor histidine kinase [Cognatishimia sp. SS12]MDC0737667.1 GAF domain-containing sensor histidine kinase [Cognatishimia sp. SS12]